MSLAVILMDQVTKSVVAERIPLHASVPVVPGLFDLTHVKNSGAAFGLFASFDLDLRREAAWTTSSPG